MGGFRIDADIGIDQRAPHDPSDTIDQRMVDATVRDMHYPVGAKLEHPELGRAPPAPYGEPGAHSERAGCPGDDTKVGQAMGTRQSL